MADTKFDAKSFNPEAFGRYTQKVPNLKRNELIKSRALVGNADIRSSFSAQTGTYYARIPMLGNLDGEAQNYDGATDLVPGTTTTFEQGVVVFGRMKSWKEKDFSYDITGGVDFMDNVAQQVVPEDGGQCLAVVPLPLGRRVVFNGHGSFQLGVVLQRQVQVFRHPPVVLHDPAAIES